jgi:hypothetical protein
MCAGLREAFGTYCDLKRGGWLVYSDREWGGGGDKVVCSGCFGEV